MGVRIAVTGSSGRLGGAVVAHAPHAGLDPIGWQRDDFDLDAPEQAGASLDRDRPQIVVHCAAWTDVDGNAREPQLAEARNGHATGVLARACAERGVGLVVVSTNEVFDGTRTDGLPYEPGAPTCPGNAYGRAKALAENEARAAFSDRAGPALWIVRTAWLFGAPGRDFPTKIVDAARRAESAHEPLRLVADEIGTPTLARDLAAGIFDLVAHPESAGTHHVVNTGHASRAEWARRVLAELAIDVPTEDASLRDWERASQPPAWGVLAPTSLPTLGTLRPWQHALVEDLRRRDLALRGAGAG
jgi:dTDP-4-dehydrorhamnose reductase